jgi:hypothetical protein
MNLPKRKRNCLTNAKKIPSKKRNHKSKSKNQNVNIDKSKNAFNTLFKKISIKAFPLLYK